MFWNDVMCSCGRGREGDPRYFAEIDSLWLLRHSLGKSDVAAVSLFFFFFKIWLIFSAFMWEQNTSFSILLLLTFNWSLLGIRCSIRSGVQPSDSTILYIRNAHQDKYSYHLSLYNVILMSLTIFMMLYFSIPMIYVFRTGIVCILIPRTCIPRLITTILFYVFLHLFLFFC